MRTRHDTSPDPTIQTTYRSSRAELIVSLGALASLLGFLAWTSIRFMFAS